MLGLARTVDKDIIKLDNHKLAKKGLSIWFINLIKMVGALYNPNGITIHSCSPSGLVVAAPQINL